MKNIVLIINLLFLNFVQALEIPSSPIKNQGPLGLCWLYAVTGYYETILKSRTGDTYDIPEALLWYHFINKTINDQKPLKEKYSYSDLKVYLEKLTTTANYTNTVIEVLKLISFIPMRVVNKDIPYTNFTTPTYYPDFSIQMEFFYKSINRFRDKNTAELDVLVEQIKVLNAKLIGTTVDNTLKGKIIEGKDEIISIYKEISFIQENLKDKVKEAYENLDKLFSRVLYPIFSKFEKHYNLEEYIYSYNNLLNSPHLPLPDFNKYFKLTPFKTVEEKLSFVKKSIDEYYPVLSRFEIIDGMFNNDTGYIEFSQEFAEDKKSVHVAVIVGYELDSNGQIEYFKIKNSWGEENGEKGFYYMHRIYFEKYMTHVYIN